MNIVARKLLNPIDFNGQPIDISDFPQFIGMIHIGDKRTRRFSLELTRGTFSLPQIMAAAYLQGIHDCQKLLDDQKEGHGQGRPEVPPPPPVKPYG